jgi:Rps23 Pro-64 3,4-dihydroxylase Tpa1-like proline 4-hydroxylase
METIQLEALHSAAVHDRPPRWFLLDGLLDDAVSRTLAAEYPHAGFTRCERSAGTDKHYRFDVLNVLDRDRPLPELDSLSGSWRTLVRSLASPEYRVELARCVGLDLRGSSASVGFYRYGPGDWVAPHLDKEEKLLTQLFYFNRVWDDVWGGRLKMLRGGEICAALPPLQRHSAIIVRTDQSWHMVEPLASDAPGPRLSAQLEIWRR